MEKFFLAAATTTAEAGEVGMGATLMSFVPMIIIIVVFYFLLIRPQRKRDKATQEMRSKVEVGDEIVTVGGLIGRVVSLKDDTIVIETGSDRSKVRIARWAIQTNNTVHDDPPTA
jgi:preprotein translocase subunit YajC